MKTDKNTGSIKCNSKFNHQWRKSKVINTNTNCYIESSFKLIISVLPKANPLQEIIGCDDNNDGISEYFDTSNVESKVLGNQTGMKVTYFDMGINFQILCQIHLLTLWQT
jgi:hypothetical protein